VSVKDVGDGLEGELRSWDANKFGNDESDGGEHGLTAVFELGFTEPVHPFGCPLLAIMGVSEC